MTSTPDQPAAEPPPEPDHALDAETRRRLHRLESDLEVLQQAIQDLTGLAGAADPAAAEPGPGAGADGPRYPSLEAWVVGYFAPMFARPVGPAVRWCPRWWDHAEAISRLEGLWRSWEAARLDELRGIAVWHRDFLDPQLAVLTSTGGPFAQCTPDRHSPMQALPTTPAPEALFDPDPDPGPESELELAGGAR